MGLRDASVSFRTSNRTEAQIDGLATPRTCKQFRMTRAQRVGEGASSQQPHPWSGSLRVICDGSHPPSLYIMQLSSPTNLTSTRWSSSLVQNFLTFRWATDKPSLTVSRLPPLQFYLLLQHISRTCLLKACFIVQKHRYQLGVSQK